MWRGDALNYCTSKEPTDKLSCGGGREYLLQRERFDFITPLLPFTWAPHTGLLFLLMLSAFKAGRGLVSQSIRSPMYKNIFPVMLCRKYGPGLLQFCWMSCRCRAFTVHLDRGTCTIQFRTLLKKTDGWGLTCFLLPSIFSVKTFYFWNCPTSVS